MLSIINRLKSSSFFHSIALLASGSLVGQFITIIASPLTTRLFTPDELGVYTLIISCLGIFGSVICLRYDLSIVTEKKEENVYALIILSFIITSFMSIVITIGYYFYLKLNVKYSIYIYTCLFMLFLLFITGVTNILLSYNNRMKEYKLMSQVYVIRTSFQNTLMVFFGFIKLGVFGLISSQLISQLISLRKQSNSLMNKKEEIKKIKFKHLKKVAVLHKNQMIYSTPAGLSNNISYSALNIFIDFLFGSSILGFYSLTYRILGLPLTLISGNVSKVFFENASREYDKNGNYKKSFIKTVKFLLVMAIPLLIVLELLSPLVIPVVFGEKWISSAYYIQILAPLFTIRFIVLSVSTGLIICKRQKIDLAIQFLFIIFSSFTVIYCKVFEASIHTFLILISLTYSIVYLLYLYFVMLGAFKRGG